MKRMKKILSVLMAVSLLLTAVPVVEITALATDNTITVSGKTVIAASLNTNDGVVGIGGIDVYTDTDEAPVAVSSADGTFTAEVPAGTEALTFSNSDFENGEPLSGTGCTIARTVSLNGGDVTGAVIPVIVCDYNGNGAVEASDYLVFASALGSTAGDAKYNAYCNLNGNSAVEASDYLVFAAFNGRVSTSYQYPALELQGHVHSYAATTTAPTCTEGGYTTYTCTACGDSYTADTTEALGHAFGVWTVTQAATCTEAGTQTRSCSRCDATETEALEALGHTAGEAVTENRTEATCTVNGAFDTVVYCTVCGAELSRTTETITAGGHQYTAVVTAPTCTEGGYTTYTCTACGDSYTADATEALGHAFGIWTVTQAATCTEAGTQTRSCSRCDATETEALEALGHTAGEAVTENRTEATCTVNGAFDTVVYCTVCGAELSRTTETVPAGGHQYTAVVTAPTCTEDGYTTYTCTACGDSYTADTTVALGHDWTAGAAVAPTHGANGYTPYTCTRCDAAKQENIIGALNLQVKLPHTDSYLYRAGNANAIALTHLFEAENAAIAIDSAAVSVSFTNIAGNAAGTFTANTDDWSAATVKFTGTGVIRVTVKQAGYASAELLLEIVNGTNFFEGGTFGGATSNNAVLLGNVNCPATKNINNGKTLYGNGFSVTDTRSSTASTSGYINMSGGGTIDNAKLCGQVYTSAVTSGIDKENYAPGIWITGNANIFNSYVSECKYAVQIDGGRVVLENSTFDGGAIANICISGADVTLKNCTTTTSTHGGLKGLGVRVTSATAGVTIEGTFEQHNWLKKTDLPSLYTSFLNSVYNDSAYAYTYNGTAYVNMGVFFITDAGAITVSQAQSCVSDSTGNAYGYVEKSAASITGTLYTAKATMGSAAMLAGADFTETAYGQYPTQPAAAFNYTQNDFTTDDKTYCTYNATSGVTQISFEEGSSMNWNSSILTVTKQGNTLPYTVSMNGTDYSGQSIPFTAAGDYTVTYTYTDPYNYDKNGTAYSVTYTKTVPVSVTVVEKGVEVYHPDFTYADIGGATASRTVEATVSGAKRVYVMPDVSATSSSIASKTVGGQTVYYPVVTVPAANSSGGTFSSGKLYYFAPAFKYIHIVDYDQANQTTKTAKYTYNSSTQKWPHNVTATTQPDTSVYYYTATNTSSNTNRPYGRSMNEQYYGYKYVSSQGGLCFSSNEIEKQNNANTQVVEFYYKGTDDVTYYYYIAYSFEAATGSSGGCVAEGTLVTMGDGTQKPIEEIQVGDEVMTRNPFSGDYEPQPVALHCNHGKREWEVVTLHFSDGTAVRSIYDHGYFNLTENAYTYLRSDNVAGYVGDRFLKYGENGAEEVTLDSFELTTENVGSYTLVSAYNYNFIVEGVLSVTSEDGHDGMFTFFEMGNGGVYDSERMQRDIETYGLYTYEDFKDYVTEAQFEALNFRYYKPNVEKGVITFDEIVTMIQQYVE